MEDKIMMSRLENLEEELVRQNLKQDERFEELKMLILMMKSPEVKEQSKVPNTGEFVYPVDEWDAKPSKRDRQSIASIFTSDPPYTPAPEKMKTSNAKELKVPIFIKDYMNVQDVNNGSMNSNLIQEIVIQESAKFSTISLKTIKLSTEKLQLFRTENPVGASKLKLAYFFNVSAMETIYNKQVTLKSNMLDNYENPSRFYGCTDDVFLTLLCDTVRPVSAEDHLIKLMSVIQHDYIDEDFQLKNFHKGPLTKAMNQLTKLQIYDSFIRYNATARDLKVLIQPGYGKDDNPKMTKVILSFFGSLAKKITLGIGEERLKKMATDEVFTEISKYLAKLSNQAHELEINENTDNACPNISSVFAKTKQKKFENSQRPINSLKVLEDDAEETKVKKFVDIEEEDRPVPDLVMDSDSDDDDFDEEFKIMMQSKSGYSGKDANNKDTSKLPCYKMLHENLCELGAKCPYQHNKDFLNKYATQMLEKWKKCPHLKSDSHFNNKVRQQFTSTTGGLRILQRENNLPAGDHT